jgi:hypothetical protein
MFDFLGPWERASPIIKATTPHNRSHVVKEQRRNNISSWHAMVSSNNNVLYSGPWPMMSGSMRRVVLLAQKCEGVVAVCVVCVMHAGGADLPV